MVTTLTDGILNQLMTKRAIREKFLRIAARRGLNREADEISFSVTSHKTKITEQQENSVILVPSLKLSQYHYVCSVKKSAVLAMIKLEPEVKSDLMLILLQR